MLHNNQDLGLNMTNRKRHYINKIQDTEALPSSNTLKLLNDKPFGFTGQCDTMLVTIQNVNNSLKGCWNAKTP